jgi:uracil-DNA glycosylase family 4
MREKPLGCLGCPCLPHGTDFSIVSGTGSLGVMIVGEASGEHEQRLQEPFVPFAPAGSLLERTIRRLSLDRAQFSITNVLRCRPKGDWLSDAPWEHDAIEHCRPYLMEAVRARRPRCIFALGGTALRVLTGMTGTKLGISHLRGYVLPSLTPDFADADGGPIPVVGSFHPAFIRRGAAHLQGVLARDLTRALNVAKGKDDNWIWASPEEAVNEGSLQYQAHPSLDSARAFLMRVRERPDAMLCYDLETSESTGLDEDARDGFQDTEIRLAQFSIESGQGIALPWEGDYRTIVAAILRTPNPKCGHNVWLFDNKVLAAAGAREGQDYTPIGTVHDTLQMYHWWQPDLPAHLQFAASFANFPFPWKHLAGSQLELYGCADVDATLRLYGMLKATMERDGLWQSYVSQVYEVRPVLAAMEDRGVPIDDDRRLALGEEFDREQARLDAELQMLFPDSCRRLSPKDGYKRVPKDYEGLVERNFTVASIGPDGNPYSATVMRWCRLEPFLPNSAQQLLSYMKHHDHPIPKSHKKERSDGTQADTTEKKELQRLAAKTGDSFYLKVIESRELGKAKGTYVEGFKPQADGRVRTTFTFDTGTGQLSSRNPNVQNFPKHGRLAGALRAMVAAPDGHILTEWDYKSFHVMTTGFEADSAAYMRMARLDMHSFIAGCFLKLWQPQIMEESDDALMDRFQWLKGDADRKRVRDKQAKPSILGVGFGMAKRRLYQENLENFPDERTAGRFLELLRALFPEVFAWQDRVRHLAHDQQFLRSRFGAVRRFYEVFVWDSRRGGWKNGDQAEEAVAFLPANDAFGEMRERGKRMAVLGLDAKYGLCNTVHDSWQFCFPAVLLPEHVAEIEPVLTAPSKVLVSKLVPGGLQVGIELNYGPSWATMFEYQLKETHHETQVACTDAHSTAAASRSVQLAN